MFTEILNFATIFIPIVLAIIMTIYSKNIAEDRRWKTEVIIFGVLCAVLIFIQQYYSHQEFYVMKADLKKYGETLRSIDNSTKSINSSITNFSKTPPVEKPNKSASQDSDIPTDRESLKKVEKSISELKGLMVGQTWGLNAEQLISLSQRMAPFAQSGDRGDLITCILGDRDSTKFAVNLVAAFRAAGWQLPGSGFNQAIYAESQSGIIIKINSKKSNPPGLREFVRALREAKIEPTGMLDNKMSDDQFQIIVGMKP